MCSRVFAVSMMRWERSPLMFNTISMYRCSASVGGWVGGWVGEEMTEDVLKDVLKGA